MDKPVSPRSFLKNSEGATAIEFAILAPVFFSLIFGIMYHSYVSFQLSHLDYAVYEAANELRLKTVSASTIDEFKNEVVCPAAQPLLVCSDIKVGVDSSPKLEQLAKWRTMNIIGKFCPGVAGDIVLVSIEYEVKGMLNNIYFGASEKKDDKVVISSRYFTVREPSVSGEGVSC